MSQNYTLEDLNKWDEKIQEIAKRMGLDWYPQEFLICDHEDMLGYMTYHGMPSHYPHWSFGKSYEKTKTMYSYGVQGLPYEMVINSDPCIAYLMKDNTLLLQILTIAHVYGHNDFFKNNKTFAFTEAGDTLDRFKRHADRIRDYVSRYGIDQVEKFIDSARALEFNCRRYPSIKKLSRNEFLDKKWDELKQAFQGDPWKNIHAEKSSFLHSSFLNYSTKNPAEPDEDILTFIRDNNPYLTDWQQDVLTIVWEESQYFIPQIETKIMNEGWASFWHFTILNSLDLPQELMWEFHIRHNQVLRPFKDQINPYYLGFKIFKDIEKRYGFEKLFQVRESDRDVSFIRQYLTQEMASEMDLFTYERDPDYMEWVVTDVTDDRGFIKVRESLASSVGMGSMPTIRVVDDGGARNRELVLDHVFDGRELDPLYSEKTLEHISYLWGKPVNLLTKVNGKTMVYTHDGKNVTKSFY